MSRKNVIIISVIGIIVLILVAIFIKNGNSNKVQNMYKKMSASQEFTFTMEEEVEDFKYKITMAQKGSNVSIESYSDDQHTTTLVVDNEVYYIDHANKEYFYDNEYGTDGIDTDIIVASLKEIIKQKYSKGKEEINGKTYYYQEYDNNDVDFVIYANVNEESKIKTRFYFDGDDMKYIKNIITTEEETEEELIKTTLSYSVQEELFEIPKDYAEVEY